jgi:hypothetical protein
MLRIYKRILFIVTLITASQSSFAQVPVSADPALLEIYNSKIQELLK